MSQASRMSDIASLETRLFEAKRLIDDTSKMVHGSVVETSGQVLDSVSSALLRLEEVVELSERSIKQAKENANDAVGDLKSGVELAIADIRTALDSAKSRLT